MALLISNSRADKGKNQCAGAFGYCDPFLGQWILLLLMFFGSDVVRAAGSNREYDIKAAFVFNFAQFVEWPTNAFNAADGPLIIGVLGVNPFGSSLDEIVRGETVRGRKIVVHYFPANHPIETCHILFVAQSEASRVSELLVLLRGKPILLVSDINRFSRRGGMITLVTEQNKVSFNINIEAAKAAGLNLSSKLLRVAHLVSTE